MADYTREEIARLAAIKKRINGKMESLGSPSPENEQGFLGDSVDAIQHGLLSGAADLTDGIGYLTGSDTIRKGADSLRGQADKQINQMSPDGREAFQGFGIQADGSSPTGYDFKDESSLKGFGLNVLSGVGSFAPTMIPGGIAAKGISAAGKVAGATGKGVKVEKVIDKASDVVGFGSVGALSIGGSTANQTYETVANADFHTLKDAEIFQKQYWNLRKLKELDHVSALKQAREDVARELATEAAKDGAIMGAITQGALGPVMGKLFRGEAGSIGKAAAIGAVTEGAQEFVESGGQTAISNIAVNPAVPTNTMDNVIGDALTGAVVGGPVGGAFGGGGSVLNRSTKAKDNTDDQFNLSEQDQGHQAVEQQLAEIEGLMVENGDNLTESEFAELEAKRNELLQRRAEITGEQPFDLSGPLKKQAQPEQLALPNQNIIYGERPAPSQDQAQAHEKSRSAFEDQFGEPRNTGREGEYLGQVFPENAHQQQGGNILDGEFSRDPLQLETPEQTGDVPALEDAGIIYGERPESNVRPARSDGLTDPYTAPQPSRKNDNPIYQAIKRKQRLLEEQEQKAKRLRDDLKTRQQAEKQQAQQTQLDGLENKAEVKAAKGNAVKAYTPSNKPVDLEYQIVNADDLVTSNNDDLTPNSNYPQALQNRDRTTDSSRNQINSMANQLIPEKLSESADVSTGSPIVRNGIVESGNGRSLAIRKAYNEGKAANYKSYLEQNADRFGINPDELSQFEKPVLVRQRQTEMTPEELTAYTKDANTSEGQTLKPSEQAKSDANRIQSEDLELVNLPDSGDVAAPSNKPFVSKFLNRLSDNERAGLVGKDGQLTQQGATRVQNAIFAKAYQSDDLINDATDATSSDVKSVTNALVIAAPEYAKLNNEMPELTKTIVDAVSLIKKSRRDDIALQELTSQFDIETGEPVDSATAGIATFLNDNVRSAKRMGDGLSSIAKQAKSALQNSQSEGLFGASPEPTVKGLIETNEQVKQHKPAEEARRENDASDASESNGRSEQQQQTSGRTALSGTGSVAQGNEKGQSKLSKTFKRDSPKKKETVVPGEKIEDVGEKIGGARKDAWGAYQDQFSGESDIIKDPLSKSFPQIDYEKAINEGGNRTTIAFIALLRDSIPPKPKKPYLVARWAPKVEKAKGLVRLALSDQEGMASLISSLESSNYIPNFKHVIDVIKSVSPEKTKEAATYRIRDQQYRSYDGVKYDPPKTLYMVHKNALRKQMSKPLETIEDAKKELVSRLETPIDNVKAKPQKKLGVYTDRYSKQVFVGWKGATGVLRVKKFDSLGDARGALQNDRESLETLLDEMKKTPSMRNTLNLNRVGPEKRSKDVSADEFMVEFGFRGVEFGNYVEQGKRQKDINRAFDGLSDLAELLGIPNGAISLNGDLSLAFGARGKGGKNSASAHYEPGKIVINLTKKDGAGSLAHEWWHAMDNYFSKQGESLGNYATEGKRNRNVGEDGIRSEVIKAFQNVMSSINSTDLRSRSYVLDGSRTKTYWSTKIEMSARTFEAYVKSKLEDKSQSNDYLANIRSEDSWGKLKSKDSYPYPTSSEMKEITKAFDQMFQVLKTKETDKGIALFSVGKADGAGSKVEDIRKAVEPLIKQLHEENTFQVVQSVNDLPFAVRLLVKKQLSKSKGDNATVRGVNAGAKNYLIADGIKDEKEAVSIFLHEVVGHKAVLDMLGKEGDSIMERIAYSYGPKQLKDLIKAYGADFKTKEGRILLGKEKVAQMAEKNEKPSLLGKLVANVKAWLRKHFPNIKWSDNDVLNMLVTARDKVESRYMVKVDLDPTESKSDGAEKKVNLSVKNDFPDDIEKIISDTQAKPKSEETLLDKAKGYAKKVSDIDLTVLKQGFIDSYASIESLEKEVNAGKLMDGQESAYKAALRTANLDSVMEVMMRKGALEIKDGAFQVKKGTKGLLEIFQPIADADHMSLWETWAGARRAKRIIEEDTKANSEGIEQIKEYRSAIAKLRNIEPAKHSGGLTEWQQDMLLAKKGLEAAKLKAKQKRERNYSPIQIKKVLGYVAHNKELKASFETAQKEWAAFNKAVLDMTEQAGLINPEARKLWENDDYVPFHRVSEAQEGESFSFLKRKKGLSGQKSGIEKLSGGVEKLNILESMVRNATHMTDASFKNIAMQRIVDIADGVAMEKMPSTKMDLAETKAMLETMGYDASIMDNETLRIWANQLERYQSTGKGTVSVSENGLVKRYQVTDPTLFRAISQLGPMRVSGIMKVFQIPKRLLTTMVTSDPGFMAANFIRDTLSTWVTVDAKTTPLYDAIKGAAKGLKRSDSQWAMMAAGAGGGGYYDTAPESVRQHLSTLEKGGALHKPKQLWDAWMRIGQAGENANRIAVFDAILKDGGTVAEAAHQAQDVINFSKRGDWVAVQTLITMVPFMNARIQGLDRLWRGAKDNPRAFMMKGSIIMGAGLALLAANWDNEEYWDLDEWDRDANWHAWIGGKHIRIPKPFEVGAFFGTIPERAFEQLRDDADGKLLGERMLAMMSGTFAMNPTPQLFKPAIDVAMNENGFTGNPILSMGDEYRTPEGQYSPWTSETMKQLAKSMPDSAPDWMRSPKRLEYLFKGYFGTLGGYALSLSDVGTESIVGVPTKPEMNISQLPVLKRFYKDGTAGSKHIGRFYDMLDEVNSLNVEIKSKIKERQVEDAKKLKMKNFEKLKVRKSLNRVASDLSTINARIKSVYTNKSMTAKQKRELIDKLSLQRNEIASGASLRYYELFR